LVIVPAREKKAIEVLQRWKQVLQAVLQEHAPAAKAREIRKIMAATRQAQD
jgi:hypothetical protein